ncbi:MAG: hypothetical protein PHX62_06745 [Bacilli bacterium]|nr:hypothetical protein [Bacilli bacterium]
MSIGQPLKLRFYTYRLFYLIFWLFILCITILCSYLQEYLNQSTRYISIALILSGFLASFSFGVYEYHRLWYHYYFLKPNSLEFYFSNLLFAFINALIQTLGISIAFIIYGRISNPLLAINFPLLLFIFLGNLSTFSLAVLLTLFLRFIPGLGQTIYILGLAYLIFQSGIYFNEIILYIEDLLNSQELLLEASLFLFIGIIIVFYLVYLKLIILKKKKALSKR